ncbi:MAG: hypothetical protein ACRD2J_17415 [Thermoanaerobaculia bacterium]
MSAGAPVDLSGGRLAAIAKVWKERRETIVARFGGRSMLPTISSETDLELACGDLPRAGEVVAYEFRDQLVVHRVLAVRHGVMLTRGDAAIVPDSPVLTSRVLGVVRGARLDGREVPLDPPPSKRLGSWAARSSLVLFELHPRAAGAFIRVLWLIRRVVLKLVP